MNARIAHKLLKGRPQKARDRRRWANRRPEAERYLSRRVARELRRIHAEMAVLREIRCA